jgi:putative phosphoesterase
MKILILSDIHANWHALEAIVSDESYEYLIFLGDTVDFGPNPRECTRFLMKSAYGQFRGVRGDHDHAMAYGSKCLCSNELKKLSQKTREWGEGLLDSEEIGFFRTLPKSDRFIIEGLSFFITHCNGNDGTHIHTDPDDISIPEHNRPNGRLHHDFVITGHSHKPFIKKVGGTTYLNPGSVGQPRDFNPRASYAVIEDGEATIKRTNYDIEKTVKELQDTSLPKKSVGKLISMLVVGGIVN